MPPTPATSGPSSAPSSTSEPGARIVYEFANFRLDPVNRQLCCDGKDVPLPGRAFDVLLLLVRKPGALVTKDELLSTVWSGSFVEESNLTVAISTLRRALNEDPHDRRFIQTVARRGYRFIAEVTEAEPPLRVVPMRVAPASTISPQIIHKDSVNALRSEPRSDPQSEPQTAPFKTVQTHSWPLAGLIVLLLAVLAAASWHLLKPRLPIRTLAVLPFTVEGTKAASTPDEIALLGMTDGLISRLEGDLIVRPASSVLRYSTGDPVDPVAAGREQAVDAVLTGALQTSPSSATLRLNLIRVSDGLTLWQRTISSTSSNLPQLQPSVAQAVANELHHLGAIATPQPPAPATHTNETAYQLYLRGRYFWNRRTVDGLHKAADYFKQSIAADPNYAPAYAGLADSYALLASFSVEPGSAANADARSAALSAIQLDPTLAEPHASLGMIYFFTDWNLAAAEHEFERSIQLNPNYATAHHWYALDLAAMGRFPQAIYEIRLAQKLDPLSLIIGTNVGWIEYLAHDYPAATAALNKVLELDPTFVRARTRLGMIELATGNSAEAVTSFQSALSGDPANPDPYVEGLLGDAQAQAGNAAAAERTLAELRSRASSHYVPPISRALVLIGLKRSGDAMAALSQAVDDHSTSMVYARVDPSLDAVRSSPEFQSLMARMKM